LRGTPERDKYPLGVNRVTVIGNGGAGKTVLSRRLAEELDLPLFHMDRIIWQPNWGRTPDEEVCEQLEGILETPRWVIDGLGPLWSIEMRLRRAEMIVFLDYPLAHCKKWAIQRTEEYKDKERTDAPAGCSFNGLDETLLSLLERVDREFLPTIRDWLTHPDVANKTQWLKDPAELDGLYTLVRAASSHG
jgi:adenylate kinase family enzyme